MRRKLIRPFPPLDHVSIESKMEALIEEVESLKLSGPEKKQIVIERLAKWFDDAVKLPWYLEPFDRKAAKLFLSAVWWLFGGWLESVFARWKAKLSAPESVASSFAELVEEPKKKKSKDAAKS